VGAAIAAIGFGVLAATAVVAPAYLASARSRAE
jgi:hypothetical protein